MTPEDLESHFRVHCVGVFRCTKAAVPFLAKAERPVVVNITSRRGSLALNQSESYGRGHAYIIAKCAQNMLTLCLDRELRQRGIRVFALHPGARCEMCLHRPHGGFDDPLVTRQRDTSRPAS